MSDVPSYLQFPKNLKEKLWTEYLERPLTYEERHILDSVRLENNINRKIKEMYDICKKKNMYISKLTNMDGNCLFESLNYHNIGFDVLSLRAGLATLMYFFKTTKNFFPHLDSSLEELFNSYNEVEYVYTAKEVQIDGEKDRIIEFYKYTYNVMCQDLMNESSWSKLPTQIILMVISYLYKVNIVIINNVNEYEMNINVYESIQNKPAIKTIFLGNLGESHYLPIDILKENEEVNALAYTYAIDNFFKWGYYIQGLKVKQHELKQAYQKRRRSSRNKQFNKDNDDKNGDDFAEITTTNSTNDVYFS